MVAGIGASAGGVSALRSFFKALPKHADLAFVVVLHSQPERRSQLAELLRSCTALRDNEHRFRAFVMSNADIVYRMSPDWLEMWQLRGAGRIADLPEPSTDWLSVYIHLDDRERILEAVRLAIKEKSIFDAEYRVRRTDGSFAQTNSRAVPILDEQGRIIEWLGTVRDLTEAQAGNSRSDR